jgi:hypothetical protein
MTDPTHWHSKTRQEVEAELLARMEACKAEYENVKVAQLELMALCRDIEPGTPDGILTSTRAVDGARALAGALDRYQNAVRQFNSFLLGGEPPV